MPCQIVEKRPTEKTMVDVMRQPGTLIAAFLAVGLIVGFVLLYIGSTYAPSRMIQTDLVVTNAPNTPGN